MIRILPGMEKLTLKYSNFRKKIVQKEIIMAKITSNDKILVIGCGPFPYTAIALAEETCSKIVAIDKNKTAVKLASSYIQKIKLSDMIKIEYGEGVSYPVKSFDVIVIDIVVWPIDKVLNYVLRNVKNDARIICREQNNTVKEIINNSKLSKICLIQSSINHSLGKKYKSLFIKNKTNGKNY